MKREAVLLILGLFLMVFMIGEVSALTTIQKLLPITSISNSSSNEFNFRAEDENISLTLDVFFYPLDTLIQNKSVAPVWQPYIIPSEIGSLSSLYIKKDYQYFHLMSNSYSGFTRSGYEGIYGIMLLSSTSYNVQFKTDDNQIFIGNIILEPNYNLGSNTDYKGWIYIIGVLFDDNSESSSQLENRISALETWKNSANFSGGNTSVDLTSINNNISSLNQRVTLLQSWQQSVNNTLTTIQTSITSILNSLTGYNTRISKIENSTSNGTTIINNTTIIMNNRTNPYLNYLSSSQRKTMVCGYAEDNNLTSINDLGWNCTITYKTTRGRTTSTCKCK